MFVIAVMKMFILIFMVYVLKHCDAQTYLPFGVSEGDTQTQSKDGAFAEIDLTESFKFYGNLYSKLYINEDGIISFNSEIRVYDVNSFPVAGGKAAICVLCADVDVTKGGEVWYGVRSDPTTRNKVGDDIKAYFANFNPSWVFVGTWNNVRSYANKESEGTGNVFQVVVARDSGMSVVIFHYKNITWVSDNLDPDMIRAKSGFNAGDGVFFYMHPDSTTKDMVNIDEASNYGNPGMFIYKVDTTIEQPNIISSTSAITTDLTMSTTSTESVSPTSSSHTYTVSHNDLTTSPVSSTPSSMESISSSMASISSSLVSSPVSSPVSSTSPSVVSSTTPSSVSATSPEEQRGLPGYLIAIYASLGSACGLLMIVGAVYFFYSYSQKKHKPVPKPNTIHVMNNGLSNGLSDQGINKEPFKIPRPKLSHNRIHVV